MGCPWSAARPAYQSTDSLFRPCRVVGVVASATGEAAGGEMGCGDEVMGARRGASATTFPAVDAALRSFVTVFRSLIPPLICPRSAPRPAPSAVGTTEGAGGGGGGGISAAIGAGTEVAGPGGGGGGGGGTESS